MPYGSVFTTNQISKHKLQKYTGFPRPRKNQQAGILSQMTNPIRHLGRSVSKMITGSTNYGLIEMSKNLGIQTIFTRRTYYSLSRTNARFKDS